MHYFVLLILPVPYYKKMSCCRRIYIKSFLTIWLPVFVLLGNSLVAAGQQPMIHIEVSNGKITRSNEQKAITPGAENTRLNSNNFYPPYSNNSSGNQKTFTVAGPITLTVTTTGSTCMSYSGSVIALASGGTPPYKYSLSGSFIQNNGIFPKLRGGNYVLDVVDALGQTASVPVIVGNTYDPPTLSAASYTVALGCNTADASMTLSVSGGLPPYQYTTYDEVNYQSSNIFTGLYPGDYFFVVKDANGCEARHHVFNDFSLRNSKCNAIGVSYSPYACGSTGVINLKGLGPDPPYQYSLDGINYQSGGDFFNLTSGSYLGHFKDAKGNIEVFMVSILKNCNLEINFITVDAALMTNLLTAPGNGLTAKGVTSAQLNTWNTGLVPSTFFRGANGETTTIPKAYINYIFLDEQFKYAGGNFSRVGSSGTVKNHWNTDVQLQNISVPKNGYIFVYVSNESNLDVFFDNLQVIHKPGPILEETHYYPFGLRMEGICSKAAGSLTNKRQFGGKELQSKEFSDGSVRWFENDGHKIPLG
jgi:hypothetical protein